MAVGVFSITELLRVGANRQESVIGEVFEWTSDRTPSDPVRGGARAAPLRPWTFGGRLRTARTDYPGARTPSEQVLGPTEKSFSLAGRFDDRYNFRGFAVAEMRRFRDMCRRGNPCRIQFQNQTFEVLIIEWDFDYHKDYYIPYKFSVSNHDRPENLLRTDRSPSTAQSPQDAFDKLEQTTLAMVEAQGLVPRDAVASDLTNRVETRVGDTTQAKDVVGDTLDEREFSIDADAVVGPFDRLATQFREAQAAAFSVTQELITVRADTEVGIQQALKVLQFEDWVRSQRFFARIVMGQAAGAADELEEREEPNATRLYRPFAGESLYRVATRFYGSPDAWRLIAARNNLSTTLLTGEETLIIPERGLG